MDGNTVAILGAFLSGLLMIAWQGRVDRRAFREDLKEQIQRLEDSTKADNKQLRKEMRRGFKKVDEEFKEVHRKFEKVDEELKDVRKELGDVKVELADVGGQLTQINRMVYSGQPPRPPLQAVDPELIAPEVDQEPETDSSEVVDSQQAVAAHKG